MAFSPGNILDEKDALMICRLLAWHSVTHEMLSHHRLLQRILVRPVAGQSSLRFDGLFHILILDRPHESWLYILDGLGTTHFDLDCEVMSLVCIACSPCENLDSHACPSAIHCLTCTLSTTVAVFQGC